MPCSASAGPTSTAPTPTATPRPTSTSCAPDRATIRCIPDDDIHAPIWVFGYGSLVWRPAMAFVDRRAARLHGWTRRFWQSSTDHRGTPDAPGRVLTLVEADAALWGVAYAIDRAAWPAIEAALEHREQQGYARLTVDAALAAGDRAGPIVETVPALLYVATPANPYFIGPEPLAATAAIVSCAQGPSGRNRDYVLELGRALAALDARDPEVDALIAALD